MYLGILQDLGLTLNEAKIYQTLLEKGELTISALSLSAKIHRRNIYDNLKRLIGKGLVFQNFNQSETVYRAVNPQQLLELIKYKEEKVKQILPKLEQIYRQQSSREEISLFQGSENIKKIWQTILTQKQPCYVYNIFPFWRNPLLKKEFEEFVNSAEQLKLSLHYIFDPEFKDELSVFLSMRKNGFFYKFFNQQKVEQLSFCVFGDQLVNFVYQSSGADNEGPARFYMISDKLLAKNYLNYFKSVWQQL